MDELHSNKDEDDHFFDAFDDFPFYDCPDTGQSESSTSISTTSLLEPSKHEPQQSPESSSPVTLRRRRSLSQHNRHWISTDDRKDPNLDLPERSETSRIHDKITTTPRERRYKKYRDLRENERESEKSESTQVSVSAQGLNSVNEQDKEKSTVTTANDDRIDNSVAELDDPSSNFLEFLARLVIKAVEFQIRVLINLFTFPIWSLYYCYSFVIDPFQMTRRCRECLMGKLLRLWSVVCECVSPYIYRWLKEQKSIWKLALRFGWGFLWAVYVCCMLCGFLVSSFVVGSLMMRYIVKEPIHIKEALNFDYTKNSPVAFVPIISCPYVTCGINCGEQFVVGKNVGWRVIPPNHNLQVTVSLTLPESDYNRNLGMFQVRVDFLSANGKALASSSHPCMLQFKSQPIRLLLTFLQVAPLIAGYLSESQALNVKMRGFTERDVPTSCLRVIIEQRAEFRPGAGIPEIYAASLTLESELPLSRRIMWYWRKTLFIWTSMMLLMMELLLALVCCRSIIIPRVRTRDASAGNNTQNNQPVQRS